MIPISVFLIVVVVILYGILSTIKPKNFPPGPKWYPFIGTSKILSDLTVLYGSQCRAMQELAKKHSTEVLGLNASGELIVVVFGKKNVRHVFMEKEFDYRPTNFFSKLRCLGNENMGITFANGLVWKVHRHFALKHLRSAGFGKTIMEKEIQNELERILYSLKRTHGRPIGLKTLLGESVMNVLWRYVAGERIMEEKLAHLLELLRERSRAFTMAGGLLNQLPICRYIIPDTCGYSLITKINKEISNIIQDAIRRHKRKEVVGPDFMYAFLKEVKYGIDSSFTEEQLQIVCLDFLVAGSQTTSTVTEFAFLRAMKSPDMQEKIHKEIDSVLGEAVPCWNDTGRLIYTSAFLQECLRYYPVVPMAGPRKVLVDTNIDGYTVPKNTTILMSMSDMHFDKDTWGDPFVFRPERFISDCGMLNSTDDIYPFGLGRRRCPGDSLARSFIFITFVGIMQKYKITSPSVSILSDIPVMGILSTAPAFTAQFKSRK